MNWKALYVNSRSEKKVMASLQERNLNAYIPLKTELKQWSDRKKKVITPLISGYVFVKTSVKERDEVFKVNGVIQYVRYNGTDAIIKDSEIEILKSIEEKGYHVDGKFGIDLNIGDLVEIKAGPFKGYEGLISQTKNEQVCFVVIKSIDFQLKIQLPNETLQKI
jgi:transcriptional antiterminator RfaH